ncbi:uncharacterized protein N7511_002254 [Penicillium nucicola]|uniref:uncharacterized protein n=1 Tax=Penicillium nucicola TaxID=1850975 RepID=UPI0025455BD0|nr:uncharacterized protein N7511_002254 [Penicillium nucicola]KAJ5770203.1 hypothetical protein N7511_002254 [Penicillium nucicola]
MSWDRVIQDSDEEEPLEGDELQDIPSSADPLQALEPNVQQRQYDAPAQHTIHSAVNKAPAAPDESMFPQFNVNFDEFLQSQDRSHTMLSSSQQRREEKWIPSYNESGSGSVGGMMTEIGLAQRRLMDDDPSTAGQQLPSTALQFSVQPTYAQVPANFNFHAQPAQFEHNSFGYTEQPNETHTNENQSLLSSRQSIYDLNSNSMASMPTSFPHEMAEFPRFKERENPISIPTQIIAQQNAYQPEFYSSHDTEPISSVVSTKLIELKSDSSGSSLSSPPNSQTSAPDELSLPAAPVPVVAPVPKNKRGRPRKEAIPDSDDEDDELAFPRDHELQQPSTNGAIHPSGSEQTTETNTPITGGVFGESKGDGLERVAKPANPVPKVPKKKKAKKEKSAPVPHTVPGNDDEVIWVDTKPIETEPTSKTIPQMAASSKDLNATKDLKAAETTSKENTPQSIQNTEQPAPKKRGRKRKKPAEETPTDSPAPEAVKSHTSTETPSSKISVVVNTSPNAVPISNSNDKHTPGIPDQNQDQQQDQEPNPQPQTPSKSVPNTVETPQNQNQNAAKGPSKHSPISARSTVPLRVGLSKRARIAPLLKMVRK